MFVWLLSLSHAAPGLRFDGPTPELATAQLSTTVWAETASGLVCALGGVRIGFGQDLAAEVSIGAPLEGRGLMAEVRLAGAVLGERRDPRLSLLVGADFARVDSGSGAIVAWWLESGLVAGAPLDAAERFRVFGGAVVNAAIENDAAVLWFDPGAGLSWRPRLSPRLAGLVELEAWSTTDLASLEYGPMLTVGLMTTSIDSP